MEKINCRIINVNPETPQKFITDFGHSVDENGNKIRYKLRREKINKFLENNKNLTDSYNISIFDAVTPKDFEVHGNNVVFGDKSFIAEDKSIFYISNALSHVSIWNIEEDTLVLEDDVIFDDEHFEILRDLIIEFRSLEEKNYVLYLQISTPWQDGAPEKSILYGDKISDNICLGNTDFSGTAAYFITKETKRNIIKLVNSGFKLNPCDKMFDNMMKQGFIRYVIPVDKKLMFKLDTETYWN